MPGYRRVHVSSRDSEKWNLFFFKNKLWELDNEGVAMKELEILFKNMMSELDGFIQNQKDK